MTDPLFQFNPATVDWTAGPLAGWTYDKPTQKWFQGQFRNVHRLTRTCPTCSGPIVLDVTEKALRGEAQNHGLALRRCKRCRKALKDPAAYAEIKAHAATVAPVVIIEGSEENAELRMANATMKEELEGLYVQVAELRAKLATFDLPAAMETAARDAMVHGVGVTRTHEDGSVRHVPRSELYEAPVKMPWDA